MREIRPIYTLAPKLHDTAQRQSADHERYACAIERPPPVERKVGTGGLLFLAAVAGAIALYVLMSR